MKIIINYIDNNILVVYYLLLNRNNYDLFRATILHFWIYRSELAYINKCKKNLQHKGVLYATTSC